MFFIHITGGLVAIVAGYLSYYFPKGLPAHRLSGKVFVISMLVMSGSATLIGIFHPEGESSDVFAGLVTMYFVLTAWMVVRKNLREAKSLIALAFVTALIGSLTAILSTSIQLQTGKAEFGGVPGLVFGIVLALAAVLDLRFLYKGKLSAA